MTLIDIVITLVVAVVANLLTPTVKTVVIKTITHCVQKLRFSSRRIARIRLRQLQEELALIEAYYANPISLAQGIAVYTIPQVATLWIITVAFLYVWFSAIDEIQIHNALSGAIFGLLGYATRYPIGALVMLNNLSKVTDINRFRAKNLAAQEKVNTILGS